MIPLDCEIETRKQIEEDEDGEDTSCSSQEFEDVALREEKALSDSEIKVWTTVFSWCHMSTMTSLVNVILTGHCILWRLVGGS